MENKQRNEKEEQNKNSEKERMKFEEVKQT
jgi:hypothetical protein